MLFTTKHKYHSPLPQEDVLQQISGNHLHIHNLDFEVLEKKDNSLSIIPHAENEEAIKTLPITHVDVLKNGNESDVIITSKMRRIDLGGPVLILSFCAFIAIAAVALLFVDRERIINYTLITICVGVFAAFYVRMQMGYFDYVRKINDYMRARLQLQPS